MLTPSLFSLEKIHSHLPHRAPILLIDAVTAFTAEDSLTATRHFAPTDPLFAGHFPGNPILPGMLTVEAIAQAAALLVSASRNLSSGSCLYIFAGVEHVRFRQPVTPGHTLTLNVKLQAEKLSIFKFHGTAHLEDGALAAAATFSAKLIAPITS